MEKKIQHVALIMDGNRRWAKSRSMPSFLGHTYGFKRIEEIVRYASNKDIRYLTFWAFSTENWNREKEEVEYLMDVFRKLFQDVGIRRLIKNDVQFKTLGDLNRFPEDIQNGLTDLIEKSKDNTKITVHIALNYGGRPEIIRAVNSLLAEKIESTDEEKFGERLYTAGQPDPDLIIRTGGEMRLSGYLPWQSTYSELYFTDIYWPDFDGLEFQKALDEFTRRERRFGK